MQHKVNTQETLNDKSVKNQVSAATDYKGMFLSSDLYVIW